MNNKLIAELTTALPEITLSVGALLLLMIGVFFQKNKNILSTVTKLAILFIIITIASIFVAAGSVSSAFNNLFVLDSFAIFTKIILVFASGITILISTEYLDKNSKNIGFEYPILIMLSLVGMLLMVSANDFMTLYMGLELQSLSLYVLAAMKRDEIKSAEAGIKYFVLGALASGLVLYGISLIYGFAGATNYDLLAQNLTSISKLSIGLVVGLVLVVAGFCFKISAAPFHMWTPDVYEGVPTPVTAFFAIVPKLAALAAFIRLLADPFGAFIADWKDMIMAAAILSMAIGGIAGIWQKNIKRLLAYSSIANMGYALVGIAAMSLSGVQGSLVFMFIYILTTTAIFLIVLSINVSIKNKESGLENLEHLNGFARTNPIAGGVLALLMLSMIGLPFPPFAGFFGKFFVFSAAINNGLYGLTVVGILLSVIASFYYLRVIKYMYFDKLEQNVKLSFVLSPHSKLILIMITLMSLAIFANPALIMSPALNAAASLF